MTESDGEAVRKQGLELQIMLERFRNEGRPWPLLTQLFEMTVELVIALALKR